MAIRSARFVDYEKSQRARLELLRRHCRGRVLDIGFCQFPVSLSENIAELHGIDKCSPEAPPDGYVATSVIDLDREDIPYPDGFFDTVVAGEIAEHLSLPMRMIMESNRVLRKDGLLLLSSPSPLYYLEVVSRLLGRELCKEHLMLFDGQAMKKCLGTCGFHVEKVIGYNFWIPGLKIGFVNTSATLPELLTWQQVYLCGKCG